MEASHSINSPSAWISQAIEEVTDPSQSTEDWTKIMKICDEVAIHQQSAEQAMRTIEKKLRRKSTAEGWRSIALTLTLLETLVKNCGEVVHIQLADKEFLRALKEIIAPKNNPPWPIEEQVLQMIQYWSFVLGDEHGLEIIKDLYRDCKQQGYRFPSVHEQHIMKATISTEDKPAQSALKTMTRPKTAMAAYSRHPSVIEELHGRHESGSSAIRNLSDEQLAKLRSELDLVHINLNVFEEMTAKLEPGDEHPDDWELFIDLYKACRKMQARVVSLLSAVAIDDVAVEFLRCNDRLNRAFNAYKSYIRKRERILDPLAAHKDLIETERGSTSHSKNPVEKPTTDLDDDSDSDRDKNQLKPSLTNRKSTPAEFSSAGHSVSRADSFRARSDLSTRNTLTADHDDQSILSTRYENTRLTPLPDPIPRSSNHEKGSRRALSAASSVKIQRSRERAQVLEENEETIDPDESSENINESKVRHPNETRVTASQGPSRVKRLSTDVDSSATPSYRITGYQYVASDAKK